MTGRDIEFTRADLVQHRDALLEMNVEYASWVAVEIEKAFQIPVEALVGASVRDYIVSVLDKVCGEKPPVGVFYLVRMDGKLSGMGGLRGLRDGAAELKRIYVRSESRGRRLGEAIVERLLNDAREFGYQKVLLESAPFMQSAHR